MTGEQIGFLFGIVWLGFSLASGWAKKRSWSIGLQTIGFVFAGLQAYFAGIPGLVVLIILALCQ